MTTVETKTIIDKFKEIVASKSALAPIADSQFIEHAATFQGWALRMALDKVERSVPGIFPFHCHQSLIDHGPR